MRFYYCNFFHSNIKKSVISIKVDMISLISVLVKKVLTAARVRASPSTERTCPGKTENASRWMPQLPVLADLLKAPPGDLIRSAAWQPSGDRSGEALRTPSSAVFLHAVLLDVCATGFDLLDPVGLAATTTTPKIASS